MALRFLLCFNVYWKHQRSSKTNHKTRNETNFSQIKCLFVSHRKYRKLPNIKSHFLIHIVLLGYKILGFLFFKGVTNKQQQKKTTWVKDISKMFVPSNHRFGICSLFFSKSAKCQAFIAGAGAGAILFLLCFV